MNHSNSELAVLMRQLSLKNRPQDEQPFIFEFLRVIDTEKLEATCDKFLWHKMIIQLNV